MGNCPIAAVTSFELSGNRSTVASTVMRLPSRSITRVRVSPGLPRRASTTVPMGAPEVSSERDKAAG